MRSVLAVLGWFLSAALLSAAPAVPTAAVTNSPFLVLVQPATVASASVQQWKSDGFTGVVLLLDEGVSPDALKTAAAQVRGGDLALYYWIEVGRNVALANAHPEWMASLGMHEDWRARYPRAPAPRTGQVAKAFPWVSIRYRPAFTAQLERVKGLLRSAPKSDGLLLNDLQGAPASCGCGNLLCRWATDYQVAPTATALSPERAAPDFVKAVQADAGGIPVIPVWTTECEEIDLPADKRRGAPGTGLCGEVGCHVGLCPKEFAKQWSALADTIQGPIALLGLHQELERTRPPQGVGTLWPGEIARYLREVLPKRLRPNDLNDRLWFVVQGYGVSPGAEGLAIRSARATRPAGIIVAREPIPQSYEPRLVDIKRSGAAGSIKP